MGSELDVNLSAGHCRGVTLGEFLGKPQKQALLWNQENNCSTGQAQKIRLFFLGLKIPTSPLPAVTLAPPLPAQFTY